MLKSKKAKIIFSALAVLCVLIASSIWVSLSLKSNSVDEFGYRLLAANDSASATMTQIDHIIETSNQASTSTEYDDSCYWIYVIAPNANAKTAILSQIDPFLSGNDGFRSWIINGNRTITPTMPTDKVKTKVLTIAEVNALPDLNMELGRADLIYVYVQNQTDYIGANAISEDLYEFLHNYAFGNNKPLIMNYWLADTGASDDVTGGTTTDPNAGTRMYNLLTSDFKNSWKRTYTTNVSTWTKDTGANANDLTELLKAYMMDNRSTYVRYQATNRTLPAGYSSWQEYWSRVDGTSKLHILYVTGGDLGGTLGTDALEPLAEWMLGEGKEYAFNSIESYMPADYEVTRDLIGSTHFTVDKLYVTDAEGNIVTNPVTGEKVKKYDYIFIAPSTNYHGGGFDVSEEVKQELIKLSEDKNGLTYILFGTLETPQTSTGGGGTKQPENLEIDTSNNFGKLIDLSITTNGYAKKNNVMVIGTQWMQTLAGNPEKNPKKVSDIVTLINKSRYRTFAGSGEGGASGSVSTTAFRVLELQPSYPIDLEMALNSTIRTNLNGRNGYNGNGNYYEVPANVLNTTEIDNYADENGNVPVEYYQWDLSKAKIAYALNLPIDGVELVQMSTEEFITSKTDVTNSYDLIYIGGNSSALKPVGSYNYYPNWYQEPNTVANTTAFAMYTHTGEIAGLVNKWITNYSSTTLNGNDLTYNRFTALKNYVDAGMPIVFSNEVWTAYTDAKGNGYRNRYIDPDSNMYSLIAYCEGKDNVLSNWSIKTKGISNNAALSEYWKSEMSSPGTEDGQVKRISNADGTYGSASQVTVYTDGLSDALYELVYGNATGVRPKYTITTNALAYVEGDDSTKLKDRDLTWTVTMLNPLEGHVYKAVLMEDKDDNAEYSFSKEQLPGSPVTVVDGTAELSYSYPSDDYGAFSWKIVVVDVTNSSGGAISEKLPATGYAAISMIARRPDQPKKEATILEIMPRRIDQVDTANGQDGHTLYLDTAYQQARGSAFLYSKYVDGTIYDENGNFKKNQAGNDIYLDNYGLIVNVPNIYGFVPYPRSLTQNETYWSSKDIVFTSNGFNFQNTFYLGMYKTNLSLNRYDSMEDHEDWTFNYADLLQDDYIMNLDIMYMDDVEYYAKAAREATDNDRESYLIAAEEAKARYDAYVTPGNQEYEDLKKAEAHLREILETIRDGGSFTTTTPYGNTLTANASEFNTYDIDGILESEDYYRFFYLNQSLYAASGWAQPASLFYFEAYLPFIRLQDKMIHFYRLYRHYNMMAYGPEEYLRENYDVVVIGFYDDVKGFTDFSKDACDDLVAFLDAEGSLLMTHDNMSKYPSVDQYGNRRDSAENLTNALRVYSGMTRYGEVTVQPGTENAGTGEWGSLLPHYVTNNKDKYFFTNLSANYDLSKNVAQTDPNWSSKVRSWLNSRQGNLGLIGYPGYSDVFVIYETNQAQALPYSYAEFQIEQQISWNIAFDGYKITGTTKATQVNRGVVTTYPFFIASDLRISPTHNQAFSLDLESDQVTVWYTFAADSASGNGTSGGSNYQTLKENSSIYAASPKDGMDSYFIYSYGNITYCGAGHCMVTGDKRDNNDERRLFLNVLVNMAKKSGDTNQVEEDVILYDPDGVTEAPGNVVKRDAENGYHIDVTSGVTYPEFGFGVEKKDSQTVTDVEIFFDLDYLTTQTEEPNWEDGNHVRVVTTDDILNILNSGGVYLVNKKNCPGLITQRSYFDAYGGQYTYIVVRVTLTNQNGSKTVISKRIKIMLTKDLLDLT